MAMELITLHSSVLNERTTETVNARDLHEFLEIGRDFSNWIKARIEQYGFEEDTDFVVISRSPKRACGNRAATKDYYVSLDMAKGSPWSNATRKANKPAATLSNANASYASNPTYQHQTPSTNTKS